MQHLLVNRVVSLGQDFLPLASDDQAIRSLLDEASRIGVVAFRALFGPERLEPRTAGQPAIPYWTFSLPTRAHGRPSGLLRISFTEGSAGARWEYQQDQGVALLLAGLVAARMLRR